MTKGLFLNFSIEGAAFEESAPPTGRLVSGSPRFRNWEIDAQAGGLFAGVWEGTPGKWRVSYSEWEYFRLLSGVSIVTPDGAPPRRLVAGDSMIIRPGFEGTWEVVETTRKEYVIRI